MMEKIYKSIEGQTLDKECEKLFELANSLKDNSIVVEIGGYMGRSTNAIAEAIENKNCTLYVIDIWENPEKAVSKNIFYDKFKENTKRYDFINEIYDFSHNAVKIWDKKIDMLFIDADHSKQSVTQDINDWVKFLKKDSILAFHDYGDGYWIGVKQAVDESKIGDKLRDKFLVGTLYGGSINET